jgi:hypothetical protein
MIGKAPRRWSSAKAQSEISEPNPYRARNRQPQIIDDGVQPKPAIFALSRACIARGTGSLNPSPSTGESANFWFLSGGAPSADDFAGASNGGGQSQLAKGAELPTYRRRSVYGCSTLPERVRAAASAGLRVRDALAARLHGSGRPPAPQTMSS